MTSDRQHRAEVNRLKWELRNLKNGAWMQRLKERARIDAMLRARAKKNYTELKVIIAKAEALFAKPLPKPGSDEESFCEPELIAVYRRVTAEMLAVLEAS